MDERVVWNISVAELRVKRLLYKMVLNEDSPSNNLVFASLRAVKVFVPPPRLRKRLILLMSDLMSDVIVLSVIMREL